MIFSIPYLLDQVKSSQAHGKDQGIEQLGCWDPFPNRDYGEQLVGLNVERILYWMAQGAQPTERVAELLGLAGILPIHPHSLLVAHRTRIAVAKFLKARESDAKKSETENQAEGEHSGSDTGKEDEKDVEKREDSVWRTKNSGEHWWRHGLM